MRILDWRRTRQQVVQPKFAVRVKARFNPFRRDSAGCTIAMRWRHRLKSNSSEEQTLFLETRRTRHGSRFLRAPFLDPQISLRSQTEEFVQTGKKSFSCQTKRFGDPQVRSPFQ